MPINWAEDNGTVLCILSGVLLGHEEERSAIHTTELEDMMLNEMSPVSEKQVTHVSSRVWLLKVILNVENCDYRGWGKVENAGGEKSDAISTRCAHT